MLEYHKGSHVAGDMMLETKTKKSLGQLMILSSSTDYVLLISHYLLTQIVLNDIMNLLYSSTELQRAKCHESNVSAKAVIVHTSWHHFSAEHQSSSFMCVNDYCDRKLN